MRIWGLKILPLIAFSLLFLFPKNLHAHPGRTASDGCHYCRTNCDSWGVAWNERHCHGGYVAPTTPKPTIYYTPTPTIKTTAPILTKTPTATPKPTFSPSPTVEPTSKVEAVETEGPSPTPPKIPIPTPTPEPLTAGETVIVWTFLGSMVGLPAFLIYKIVKKLKNKK